MRLQGLFAVGLLGSCCALGFICFSFDRHVTGQEIDDQRTFPVTYNLDGLPVWSKTGQHDPTLLIELIQSSVTRADWDGKSTMTAVEVGAVLIVSTTKANHRQVYELIHQIRELISSNEAVVDCTLEGNETIGSIVGDVGIHAGDRTNTCVSGVRCEDVSTDGIVNTISLGNGNDVFESADRWFDCPLT